MSFRPASASPAASTGSSTTSPGTSTVAAGSAAAAVLPTSCCRASHATAATPSPRATSAGRRSVSSITSPALTGEARTATANGGCSTTARTRHRGRRRRPARRREPARHADTARAWRRGESDGFRQLVRAGRARSTGGSSVMAMSAALVIGLGVRWRQRPVPRGRSKVRRRNQSQHGFIGSSPSGCVRHTKQIGSGPHDFHCTCSNRRAAGGVSRLRRRALPDAPRPDRAQPAP